MNSPCNYLSTNAVSLNSLHDLELLVSRSVDCDDSAFTAAVDFIQAHPGETISALQPILGRVPGEIRHIIHWILAYAFAREAHSDAVADSLDNYLSWRPFQRHLKRTSRFVDAEVALQAAISIKDVASLWNDLGVLHFSFGYVEQSMTLFDECLARETRHRYASINYAMALLCLGAPVEAKSVIERLDFGVDLPIHLIKIVGALQAYASGSLIPKPKDCWYWYRRCVYSYGWRSSLGDLFAEHSP